MKLSLVIALVPAVAAAQPRPGAILDDLAATHAFEEVAISPDGQRVAWVEKVIERGRDTGRAAVFAAPLDGKRPAVRIGEGRHLAWSHDATRLAYIDKQLYVATIGGGARKLTSVAGYLTDPAWSPDDARIAVLFAEHAASGGGAIEARPPETGLIGGEIHNQRLTLVDPRSGAARQVSPAELNIYEYDWSPDGRTFALTAAPGPGDNNWWTAQLYTMPAATGAMTVLHKPALQIALPRWSPDGATIGFIGGLMSDEGATGGDVFTVPAAGGAATNRTAARPSSPNTLTWLSPSQMLIAEYVGGSSALGMLDVATGKLERLWQGDEGIHTGIFSNYSVSRDGRTVAVIRSDWQHPPEIWAGPIGAWKPITSLNAGRRAAWGPAKSLSWTSDGFSVQGWLLYPRDFDAARQYPMIVSVHGGPASVATPRWPQPALDPAIFSALGYFVFLPNPRGSYGQGEAFTRANVKDFGGGDLRDVLAGIDAVLKAAPVDPRRLGLMGWSYGGYMTMWTITQTQRFKAAVAGAGIANWQSYYGQNAIDQWMIPYFGASVYDDPAVYARSAPISFVKRVTTPTLIAVGERDGECPPPQSYELWHALRTLGVPTDLVVYAGEGHLFRDSAHKRDLLERAAAWFDRYLR
ncbi:MAG: S9 family peptidase [Deltaproteobacteria bacterium]|nr:MAG: S9 family peptidase [Deltaproteobacteria bacterium]